MSHDTKNQKILEKLLKSPRKIKMQVRRPYSCSSKREDLPANDYSYGYKWETQVSKCVCKLERHEHLRERETDGAINWKLASPKLTIRFQRDGGRNFSDRDWINFIWIGSNKTRFQYCQNSCKRLLCLRVIQGHTGGNDSTRDAGPRPHILQLEGVCVPSRMFVQFYIDFECWAHRRRTRSSHHLIHGVLKKKKKSIVVILRDPEIHRMEALSKRCSFDSSLGERKRKAYCFWQTKSHAPSETAQCHVTVLIE